MGESSLMLEMQTKKLRRVEAELYFERERYFDFCDLAPTGFITLSERGQIRQANLAATALLGITRNLLAKQQICSFIIEADHAIFHRYLSRRTPGCL